MTFEEACRVLSLGPAPSLAAAKAAYRRLVKLWHPDLAHDDLAARAEREARTKEINAAYRCITSTLLADRRAVPVESNGTAGTTRHGLQLWVPSWFKDFQWRTWNLPDGIHEITFLLLGAVLFAPFLMHYAEGVDDWTEEVRDLTYKLARSLLTIVVFGGALILRESLRRRRRRTEREQ
jgi:hypothetical protein